MTSNSSRQQGVALSWPTAAIVALAFIVLTPPALLAGTYSISEASLAILTLVLAATLWRPPASPFVPVPTALLALLALMLASTLWSSASLYTLRDALTYIALAAAAWVLVRLGGVQSLLVGIVGAGVLIALASLGLWVINPDVATPEHYDYLNGIYANRNQLGFSMLQVLPAVIALDLRLRLAAPIRVVLIALVVGVIAVSESRTSLVAAVTVLVAWGVLWLVRRSIRMAVGVAVLAVGGGVLTALNWSSFLELLGKNSSLSGRSDVWQGVLNVIAENLLIGVGFLREWPGGSAQAIAVAEVSDGAQMIHAHNEALSWLSALGIIGFVPVVVLYVFVYAVALLSYRRGAVPEAMWLLLTMLMLHVNGLTSTSETKPQGWLMFMLLVFVAAAFAKAIGLKLPRWVSIGSGPAVSRRHPTAAAPAAKTKSRDE